MRTALTVIAAFVLAVVISGCSGKAQSANMVYSEHHQYDAGLQNAIQLTGVQGGEETNPLWTSEIGNEEFAEALKTTLAENALLAEKEGAYTLRVTLQEVDQPLLGFSLEVVTKIRYELVEAATDRVLMDHVFVAKHTATFSDSAMAVKRLRLANEGSAKKNIGAFMEALATLDLKSGTISFTQE